MGVALLIVLFVILPLAAGIWAAVRLVPDRDWLVRTALVLGALACGTALFNITAMIFTAALFDWNGAKLAPIVAMFKGFPLYDDPDTGVMSAWIYGPVPAIVFSPVAMFQSPTVVIVLGVAINTIVTLAPVVWILVRATLRNRSRGNDNRSDDLLTATLALFTFIWVALSHESLRRCLFMVGPDGPCVAFITASCVLIMWRRTWLRMSLSAACAICAVWSKQSVLPFVIVPPLFVLITDGARNAVRYSVLLGAIGLVISASLTLSFGASNMWFHMVTLSAKQHLQDNDHGAIVAVWYAVGEWIIDATEPAAVLLAVLIIAWLAKRMMPAGATPARSIESRTLVSRAMQYVRAEPWSLLLITAIVLLPSSILGYAKIGGYYNNFALTNFFIVLAAVTALVVWWPGIRENAPSLARFAQVALCFLLFARAMTEMLTSDTLPAIVQRTLAPSDNQQEKIVAYVKAHPGIVYFPWNNLATLLAEGKMYHFEWGVVDRIEAGMTPSAEQIRRHVPEHVLAVGLPPSFQSGNALKMFPQYTTQTTIADLPGFIAVTTPTNVQPAPPQRTAPQQQPPPPRPASSGFRL